MTKTISKLVVLVFLIVLSVYQITMLWFDYPSDRNFFYSIIDSDNSLDISNEEIGYNLFYPKLVASYQSGQENYVIIDTDINDTDVVADSYKVLKQVLVSGNARSGFIADEMIWSDNHLMLEMPFTINSEMVKEDLHIDSSWYPQDMEFDKVYIYPGVYVDDYLKVIFTDKTSTERMLVTINIGNIEALNTSISDYSKVVVDKNTPLFISTKQKKLSMFVEDQLLPMNDQLYNLLPNLYSDRYFYNNDVRDTEAVEAFANYFFTNPEIAWSTENTDEIRLGDMEIIVSYKSNGMLSYQLIEEFTNKETHLNNAYNKALDFLEKDTLLSQIEYELAGYDKNDEGVTFYYNYYHRKIPIVYENLEEIYGTSYPMEISVTSNTVTSYKRIMILTEEVVIQGDPFEVRYKTPLDQLIADQGANIKIEDMYMGYYNLDLEDGSYLQWIIEMPGERRTYELE